MKLLTFLLVTSILYSCQAEKSDVITTGLEGQPMPGIDLIAFDSLTHFNITSSKPGKPTLLFAFQPSCPYCKAQTRAIVSNITSLRDMNIYMLCLGQYPAFKSYYKKYELNKYPNIKAGVDYDLAFANYFQTTTVPYLAIYDKDKKLKQVLRGKNYISTIKKIAQK